MLSGLDTKEPIRRYWEQHWDTTQGKKSALATGAERIVYALFNAQGFGQPNSAPVGSDLFFETNDAFIHIDLKSAQTRNLNDYAHSIFVGKNQNSYHGIITTGREYRSHLPTSYRVNGVDKPCLTFFITILYDDESLQILNINILSFPNGKLRDEYGDRPLKAGKTPKEIRFNFRDVGRFELLNNRPSRVKVVFFSNEMREDVRSRLSMIHELYVNQNNEI